MMKNLRSIVCIIFHLLFCIMILVKSSEDDERKPYIVYMGEPKQNNGAKLSVMDEHHNILSDVVGDGMLANKSRIHSYGKSFNGFVAHLLPHEATKLKERDNIISVFPNKVNKLMTTRSWDFVGMPETIKRNHEVESNMIVAIIDTGIYMDIPSFDDKGYGPPPKKWKGKCEKGLNFTGCNNKVIGAQFFNLDQSANVEERTPVDTIGHGTHISSIVAGNAVPGVNFYGMSEGTVRGGMPAARIAMYKICYDHGSTCEDMNILAAFDTAISDGVDIISISVGTDDSTHYFNDAIAIGAFHALKKGIPTICSGGNGGPGFWSMVNVAPWTTVVAAAGTDKQFQTSIKLGNGKIYNGISLNTFEPEKEMYPLTSGALAKNAGGNSSLGLAGWLGTITTLHGAGVISTTNQYSDSAMAAPIPSIMVNLSDGESIGQYINSTKFPSAVIQKTITVNVTAPYVGGFSSRGPKKFSPNILKPDIAGPGVNILAAYTPLVSLTQRAGDNRFGKYTVFMGTSMAAPHVAAASAYLKSFHPEWSPAAIRSALMTTAGPMKVEPDGGAVATGSGIISPVTALNPGLVYDIDVDSYISFLCKEGYNSSTLSIVTGSNISDCSKVKPANGFDGLNYPSMHIQLQKQNTNDFSAVFYRTVTNVGEAESLYKANIQSPKELSISVVPKILSFTKPNQSLSFKVDVNGKFVSEKSFFLQASLVWSDSSNHNVRSPILVFRNTTQSWPKN